MDRALINDSISQALDEYLEAYLFISDAPDNYLFFNTRTQKHNQPISRKQAWKLISIITKDVGPRGNYGTHTLRKTWGYH